MASGSGRPILAGALILALNGCGSTALLRAPEPLPEAPPLVQVSLDEVEVRLDAVVVRNAPGSWVADAFWDEYRFTVANRSPAAVIVKDVALADVGGLRVEPRGTRRDLRQLEEELVQARIRPTTGEQVAVSAAYLGLTFGIPAAVGAATAAAPVAASAATAGWPLAATAAASAPPAGVIVGGLVVAGVGVYFAAEGVTYLVTENRESGIDGEMARRRSTLPATLEAGEERRFTLFFPVVVLPSQMRVTLDTLSGERLATLDLRERLARAHAEPPAQLVRRFEPEFPREAREAGIRGGFVEALLELHDDGRVKSVGILQAQPPRWFELEAARALYRWQFTPRRTVARETRTPLLYPPIAVKDEVRRYEKVRLEFRDAGD